MNGDTSALDELARQTQARWDALVAADVAYSRPLLDLDAAAARAWLDPQGVMDEVCGRAVLCLGGGGGQQSAAFGVLGARTTVFDLSAAQLARDRLAAEHYGHIVRVDQGDMRNLSRYPDHSFDVVYHAYSIDFIPDARPALREAARVLRPGGQYRLEFSNPFTKGADEAEWTGEGYLLRYPCVEGRVPFADDHWDVAAADGVVRRVVGPQEFRHRLSTVLNTLIAQKLVILGLWEDSSGDLGAPPGTWEHFKGFAPPYLTIWARKSVA